MTLPPKPTRRLFFLATASGLLTWRVGESMAMPFASLPNDYIIHAPFVTQGTGNSVMDVALAGSQGIPLAWLLAFFILLLIPTAVLVTARRRR